MFAYSIRMSLLVLLAGCTVTPLSSERGDKIVFAPYQLALPGKRGACWTLRSPGSPQGGTWEENLPKLAQLQPYWNYSWGADWVPQQTNYVASEFVPMIWGKPKSAEALRKTFQEKIIPRIRDGTVKRVLGFNEPDKKDQANMPYMDAIKLWPEFMKLGVPLCSPACANPVGIHDASAQNVPGTWMRDFMREADRRGYRVDYIGVHWYGGPNAESFKERMRTIYEMYGKRPLLITEFAPADWKTGGDIKKHRHRPAAVLKFMKEVLPWMEAQDWIAGYAWFSFNIDSPAGSSSALFDKAGHLTACGRYYRSVTRENPQGDQTIEPDPFWPDTQRGAALKFTPQQLALPGKKGIGYSLPLTDNPIATPATNDAVRTMNAQRTAALQVSWNYSWNMHLVTEQPAGVEFVPMVFGKVAAPSKLAEQLNRAVVPQIRAGRVKRLLGPNEPDRKEHGNLTVEQTLTLWPALEALGIPLCSPSCANTEGSEATDEANQGTGGNWMPAFMREADRRGLRVDYIGTHGYPGPNAEAFKVKLRRIYEKYGRRPLLITEFGVADWGTGGDIRKHRYTQAQVLKFMKEILPWMERQDWIAGYAWFPFKATSPHGTSAALFDTEGNLTALGRYYRSVTPENPDGDQMIEVDPVKE